MRPALIPLFAGTLLSAAASTPVSAASTRHCTEIDSRKGWQRVELPPGFIQNARTEGKWSVDAANYPPVDHEGHFGNAEEKLTPYNRYRCNQEEKFGTLLVRSLDGQVSSFNMMEQYIRYNWYHGHPLETRSFDARINDGDDTLGDNAGSLDVCFTILDEFKPKER